MDFDFPVLYKDYTNIQLLQIVEQPQQYQPSAVAAARQILDSRAVTNEEIAAAHAIMNGTDSAKEAKAVPGIEDENESVSDFIDRLGDPEAVESQWIKPFIYSVLAWYGYQIFNTIKLLWDIFSEIGFHINDITSLIMCSNIVYYIAFCLLLYKRNKVGWVLFAVQEIMVFGSDVGRATTYFYERGDHTHSLDFIIRNLVVAAVFLCMLWSNPISGTYGIKPRMKTILVGIGILMLIRCIYVGITVAPI